MTVAQGEPDSLRQPGERMCAMLGADIAGYTSPARDEEIRQHMRTSLYAILGDTCDRSGIPWDMCRYEDHGDGVLVILPAGTAPSTLIDPFPLLLRSLIRRYNRVSAEAAGMQLRVAVHMGLVRQDAHGLASDDINYLFRMLDARPLRKALADSRAEVALAISGYVYESVVRRCPSLADPAQFRHVKPRVKCTPVDAWLHIPRCGPVTRPPCTSPVPTWASGKSTGRWAGKM